MSYYQENKEYIKERNAEYARNNPEVVKKKHDKYAAANRDKINSHNREKITCPCGCIISRADKSRHLKTAKHAKLIA